MIFVMWWLMISCLILSVIEELCSVCVVVVLGLISVLWLVWMNYL